MVVEWPFISCYFFQVSRARKRPQTTSEAITFEPIKIYTRQAPQTNHLNLSFVKDGDKIARNGHTTVIYEGHSFQNRVYISISIKTMYQLDFP